MIGGHGHVTLRPDRSKARCGGPRMCKGCATELAALITIPGQIVVEGEPGALKVVQADQFIDLPLARFHAAPAGVFALLDDTIRILGQVHYRITGWNTANNSLMCHRIHTHMETIRGNATAEEVRADRADRIAALQQEARDAPEAAARGDFGAALAHLRAGQRVTRAGWGDPDRWLVLVPGSTITVAAGRPLGDAAPDLIGQQAQYEPHIDERTSRGRIAPWNAPQADLLADDWMVAEHPLRQIQGSR